MTTPSSAVQPTNRSQTVLGGTVTEKALKRFLEGLPGVDAVGAQVRADGFATRSIKNHFRGVGPRHHHLHGRFDHSRRCGHARKSENAGAESDHARPDGFHCSQRCRRVCLWRHGG